MAKKNPKRAKGSSSGLINETSATTDTAGSTSALSATAASADSVAKDSTDSGASRPTGSNIVAAAAAAVGAGIASVAASGSSSGSASGSSSSSVATQVTTTVVETRTVVEHYGIRRRPPIWIPLLAAPVMAGSAAFASSGWTNGTVSSQPAKSSVVASKKAMSNTAVVPATVSEAAGEPTTIAAADTTVAPATVAAAVTTALPVADPDAVVLLSTVPDKLTDSSSGSGEAATSVVSGTGTEAGTDQAGVTTTRPNGAVKVDSNGPAVGDSPNFTG
jgi:hypothetical protein